jgi:hypothetical protein
MRSGLCGRSARQADQQRDRRDREQPPEDIARNLAAATIIAHIPENDLDNWKFRRSMYDDSRIHAEARAGSPGG